MEEKVYKFKGEITQEEQSIVFPHIIEIFLHHGKDKVINNKQLGGALRARFFNEKLKYEPRCSERGIRLYIQLIREQGLLPGLIADGSGYMITASLPAMDKYIANLRKRRAAYDALLAFAEKHRTQVKTGNSTQIKAF